MHRIREARFRRRYGFAPPPAWADFTGYEPILDVIERERLYLLEGDVLEIGVLLGGGTAKLCGLMKRRAPSKRVIAVDIFDPAFDTTQSPIGYDMAAIYASQISRVGSDQRAVFDQITAGEPNLVVVEGDSAEVEIPAERLAFSFIDGHHAAEYVRGDFETAWSRTVPGGVVGLHDYGGDLSHVTHTVHELIGEHADEIARVWTEGIIAFIQRGR